MGYEPGDVVSGFSLSNANGEGEVTLDEVMTEMGAVVVFECNHCPYVIGSINRINKAAAKAAELGMGFVGINSNDSAVYADDSFENMVKRAEKGMPLPVVITVYEDKSFTFVVKTPPAAVLIRKALGIEKGSGEPNREKVGKLTRAQLEDIAKLKEPDLNSNDIDAAVLIIAGTARSMGVETDL